MLSTSSGDLALDSVALCYKAIAKLPEYKAGIMYVFLSKGYKAPDITEVLPLQSQT